MELKKVEKIWKYFHKKRFKTISLRSMEIFKRLLSIKHEIRLMVLQLEPTMRRERGMGDVNANKTMKPLEEGRKKRLQESPFPILWKTQSLSLKEVWWREVDGRKRLRSIEEELMNLRERTREGREIKIRRQDEWGSLGWMQWDCRGVNWPTLATLYPLPLSFPQPCNLTVQSNFNLIRLYFIDCRGRNRKH